MCDTWLRIAAGLRSFKNHFSFPLSEATLVLSSRQFDSFRGVSDAFAAKGCVEQFLSNVAKEGDHLTVHERIEMIICLLCVIKDSAASTGVILQDFAQANGYAVLRDFILR